MCPVWGGLSDGCLYASVHVCVGVCKGVCVQCVPFCAIMIMNSVKVIE